MTNLHLCGIYGPKTLECWTFRSEWTFFLGLRGIFPLDPPRLCIAIIWPSSMVTSFLVFFVPYLIFLISFMPFTSSVSINVIHVSLFFQLIQLDIATLFNWLYALVVCSPKGNEYYYLGAPSRPGPPFDPKFLILTISWVLK